MPAYPEGVLGTEAETSYRGLIRRETSKRKARVVRALSFLQSAPLCNDVRNGKVRIQLAVWRQNAWNAAPVLDFHFSLRSCNVGQPRAFTSCASFTSGSTATGFATADSSGKSLIESL